MIAPAANSTPNLQALSVSDEELISEVELVKRTELLTKTTIGAQLAPSQDRIGLARTVSVLYAQPGYSAV